MKVLVVDDDAINRLILKKVFEKENHEVFTANNGVEAIDILEEQAGFDLVITDIMMPQMDGLELLAKIKHNKKINKLPIIGLTAGNVDYFRNATKLSFDILLQKPMDFYEIYAIAQKQASKGLD
ncbi:two-component hybrid sensor and regulator [Indibacter alkaliphilus LW1]|jgi:CheY-like chemotaxis protein|uniref:Two-component hybrid sensor and regulator n=1 Tax=Indibacter alkaliphilus (strain CCUG 57479 / KCTC 22604 / LW1) TaxID=1189612 RepID=S2DPP5_INDAL|nr:response regulator [Indibacter alkaliphilus]EOZ99150.1 two-component hybrid sensor and regulator [Indibacter alkaliphilus LW1]